MTDESAELRRMIDALALAGAEWEAMTEAQRIAAVMAADPDWLVKRAAELVATLAADGAAE